MRLSENGFEWRVIFTNVETTVICQINTTKLVLTSVDTEKLLIDIENKEIIVVD